MYASGRIAHGLAKNMDLTGSQVPTYLCQVFHVGRLDVYNVEALVGDF